ncbi:MAG: imidazole glycerol phosphate synthase subunit HisH [Acidimicrobiia bacterium]
MNKVAVVDYGLCNVDSVLRALDHCGAAPFLAHDPTDLKAADRIVLPGVGAFDQAMERLDRADLVSALTDTVLGEDVPFLGICLGMQLLARRSEEGPAHAGLGWLAADVVRIAPAPGERVPHIGWNEVMPTRESPLLAGIPDRTDFYFVHSFHLRADDPADVLATVPFAGGIAAIVARPPLYGVQFHPEKSQQHGLALLRNFLAVS